jgi:hypothetical protein
MNERIKKLAEQAGGNPNYKAFRGYFLPPPPDYIDPATVNLEKFAELIVRECAKFTFKYTSDEKNIQEYNQVGWDFLSGDLRNAIKQHFGVEE